MRPMLRVVGLGPGAADLLTLRAVEALRRAEVVYVPRSSRGESLARRIVERYAAGEVVELEVEMGGGTDWRRLAETITSRRGERVYALLGDPALYSTFAKLRKYIDEPVEYIPGVSAVVSCSLRAGIELATEGEAVAIVPANRPELIEKAVELFDAVVIVKANTNIELINRLLERARGAAVRRCYMAEEAVAPRIDWRDYFTTVYLWPRGR